MGVRFTRVLAGTITGFALLAGAAALAGCEDDDYVTTTVAEDCDVEDQHNNEDECGYWQSPDGASLRTGEQPDFNWIWIWYPWVQVGRASSPPSGWKPPKGLTFPQRTVRVPKKNCALGQVNSAAVLRIAPPPPPPRIAPPPAPRPPAVNPPPARPQPGGRQNPPAAPKPPANGKIAC